MSKSALCRFLPLTAVFLVMLQSSTSAQGTKAPLINAGFEKDLLGWNVQGEAGVSTVGPLKGIGSLRLGPGKAVVSQRYAIGGLRIAGFGAALRADPPSLRGAVRVRCYDAQNRLLMDIRQGSDPKKVSSTGNWVGTYFKTQARTASLVVSIEKEDTAPGCIYADAAQLDDYDRGRTARTPTCDLNHLMQPAWQGNTVYNETVLLQSDGAKPASGTLLFLPKKILSVQNYGLTAAYVQGKDYILSGRTITAAPKSRMQSVKAADFPAGDLKWYDLDGKHIVVTYTHADSWHGPVPRYEGDHLPRTMSRLRHHLPLTVIADGDSITLGNNVSGYMQIPPYLPTWAELFVGRLKQVFGDTRITLCNTALGGMTSEWGLENADSAVAALDPDLVLIAFGMNDFWSLSPEEFRRNIQGTMQRVRRRRPQAEFLLISSIRFDPAYAADPAYTAHMAGYVTALRSLTGEGVRLLDMNALSGALFAAKKPKDLLANPLHPNDFLARWYAQGLVALLTPPARRAEH